MYSISQSRSHAHHVPHMHTKPLLIAVFSAIIAIMAVQHVLFLLKIDISKLSNSRNPSSSYVVNSLNYNKLINDYDAKPITLTLYGYEGKSDVKIEITKGELGFALDSDRLKNDIESYDAKQSLIPLGGLLFEDSLSLSEYISVDSKKLAEYAKSIHDKNLVVGQNATISFDRSSNNPIITDEIDGYEYSTEQIAEMLGVSLRSADAQVGVSVVRQQPKVTRMFLEKNIDKLASLWDSSVQFNSTDQQLQLRGNNQLLDTVIPGPDNAIDISDELLEKYIDKWVAPAFSSTPSPAIGSEIPAYSGKSVDTASAARQYKQALLYGGSRELSLTIRELQPPAEPLAAGDISQGALQALVNHLGKQKGTAIAVAELKEGGRSADSSGSQTRVAASTYKLVVAYAVASDISSGKASWDSPIMSYTYRSCLESMLVRSTNHCATEWARNIYGFETLNRVASSIGLNGTCFGCEEYAMSSVIDQTKLMQAFYNAEKLNPDVAAVVTDMLDRQIYREGIPYGLKYNTYNKIGWVPGYYNDTAIIEIGETPVALSIYTSGYSWGEIRNITKSIVEFLEK